jgi:hypothetical protein
MRLATETYVDSVVGGVSGSPTAEDIIESLIPSSLWKLDEKTGLFLDSGAAHIDATYANGTRFQRGHRAGSKAVWYQGNSPLATFGNNYDFLNHTHFTVLAIHYLSGADTSNPAVVDKRNGGATAGWVLGYSSSNLPWIARSGGGSVSADAAVPYNEWNLIAGVYDGTNLAVYANGVYKSAADAYNLVSSGGGGQINGFSGGGSFGAKGRFDTVAIWDGTALTEAQLDSIWATI